MSGNYYIIYNDGIKKKIEPDCKDNHELLLKFFDIHNGTRTVWGRLIRLSLYNNHHIRVKEGFNVGEDWQQTPLLAYYANIIATLDEFAYYYDCTNAQSYIHSYQKALYCEQTVESLSIVESFFADKEQEYKEASHRLSICKLKQFLHIAAKNRNKHAFDQIKTIILSNYSDCLNVIGWDNSINRVFRCNYALHSSYRCLYEFGKEIVKHL